MESRRIVVTMKVADGNKRMLVDAKGMEPGNGLADPELIVRHATHNFVAHGSRRVLLADCVHVSRNHDRVTLLSDVREQRLHLSATAGGSATVLEMSGDDGCFSAGQIRNRQARD